MHLYIGVIGKNHNKIPSSLKLQVQNVVEISLSTKFNDFEFTDWKSSNGNMAIYYGTNEPKEIYG